MKNTTFKALVVEESAENKFTLGIKEKSINDLPDGEVLIRVEYSSLNYKDALSATGSKGVTKKYPHTPGIDAAGIVKQSSSTAFKEDDPVIVTGYDLGMNTSGGFGQYIRVPSQWVIKLPSSLTLKESMIYGTAGFTAGMSVYAITDSLKPEGGEILVTGATGGVGSVSVAILSKLGYSVIAVSGKPEGRDFLRGLGAKEIISRNEGLDTSGRPILKGRWSGAIDTVGGDILATAIKSTKPLGTVACCGNVASADLPITVFPFILRGVKLIGIDSQNCPMEHRLRIWNKLSEEWQCSQFKDLYKEISLEHLNHNIDLILKGMQKGRIIINLDT